MTLSSNNGFSVDRTTRVQASDGPNDGATSISSALLVFLPEPNTAIASSEFVTNGTTGTTWSVRVYGITAGAVGASVFTRTVPVDSNTLYVPMDPAVFPDGDYRVEIRDPGDNIADQYDISVFSQDNLSGSADVQAINNAIARIAGLSGFRQQIEYDADYYHGEHRGATVSLLDSAGAVIATYRVNRTLDQAAHVIAETSVALDDNNLGAL